ncbi:MAG: sulfur oxidation c-type cytochrome SoxA [Solirubrobacterales bacterium]
MTKAILAAAAFALAAAVAGPVLADPPFDPKDPKYAPYMAGDKRSGYTFAEPETRAMQDDDFTNPGFLWVEKGEKLWSKAEGPHNKACSSCHGKAEDNMKGVGATYPKYDLHAAKVVDLEQRINMCREKHMGVPAWKWESEPLLAMTTFVKHQSRGMPISVQVDGPAAPYFEAGRRFYYERRGMNDLACKHCHEDLAGNHLRTELLSQGQANGFPTYRLKWQKLGSLQRRLAGCNEEIRAEPFPLGSDEYTNLEFFLAWRAQGLKVETPSVRK